MNIHLLNKTRIMTKKFAVVALALMSVMTTEVFAQTSSQNKSNEKSAVLKIHRTNKQVTMVSETAGKKDTVTATRTRVCDVSDSVKLARYEAKLKGEQPTGAYFDNHNKDITGKKISRPFVELGGGGTLLFDNSELRPELVVNAGWESRYFLLMATGYFSGKAFNSDAEAGGSYQTFGGLLGGGPKLWSSNDFNSYLAVIGQVGYGYEKTDGDDEAIRFSSSFYGLKWRGLLRFHYGFNSHWGVSVDAGVTNTVRNHHDSDQDKGGVTAEATLTLGYSF
jgi:hypothetical protein